MEVYVFKLPIGINRADLDIWQQLLTLEKQYKIKRYKNYEDSLRSLTSELFIRSIICKTYNIANQEINFIYNQYGKPRLLNQKNFHFNISHSGNWVVCAIDNHQIGVDVEEIKNIDLNIVDHFFSKEESNDLKRQNQNYQLNYFYELWTLKESYIKAIGKGFTIPLNSFTIKIRHEEIQLIDKNQYNDFYFKQLYLDNQHKLSVCYTTKKNPKITLSNFTDCIPFLYKF